MSGRKVWNRLGRPDFGISNTLSDFIATLEDSDPHLLTDLRVGPNLILTCDYSGQHKRATYESYAFLIADLAFTWLWDEMRQETRKIALQDSRRMSFKALNDSRRRQALVPLLRAANTIPGLLLIVLVDKSIGTLFKDDEGTENALSGVKNWHKPTLERFLRMAHLGSLLLAGLSAEGQNVLWITDEDDIVANSQRIVDGTKAISHISSHYLRHTLGHLRYGSTKSDDGSFFIEDLAAIPDLAAGALNELTSHGSIPRSRDIRIPLSSELSLKTQCITGWLGDGQLHPLKRIFLVLDAGEGESIRSRAITLETEGSISEYMWHQDFHRITRKP